MKCHRQFHHAEVGRKMAACFGNSINHQLSYLSAKFIQFINIQFFYIFRRIHIL